MIRVTIEVRHPQGEPDIFVPKFVCAKCGHMISHLSEGMILYPSDALLNGDGDAVDATVVHKIGICSADDAINHLSIGSMWMPLELMVDYMQVDETQWKERHK